MANSSHSQGIPVLVTPEQTYAGTIVWDGTAPSGTPTHTYRWASIGKLIYLRINLKYSVAGATNTTLTMTLPSDCPAPVIPTGFSAADNDAMSCMGLFSTSATTTTSTTLTRAFIRENSSANGILIAIYASANTAASVAFATVLYISQ